MPREDHDRDLSAGAAHDLLALAIHELRTPLTVIAGYLQVLERKPLEEAARHRAIDESLKAVRRMAVLLDDLAGLPSPRAFLTPATLAPVGMTAVSADVAAWFAHVDTHTVRVVPCHPDIVRADAAQLHQALGNLVGNAIAHTPDGCEITIAVTCDESRVITVVEDDGPGIPPEARELVFGRFVRLPGRADPSRPGSGLGLYIVRAIIDAHGGTVRITEGTAGRGTRVRIELPAESASCQGPP